MRRFHSARATLRGDKDYSLKVAMWRVISSLVNARDIEYPSAVVEQFKLPALDRNRILRGNAMRLFHL